MAQPVTFSWDINDRVVEVEGKHVDLAAEAKFARILTDNEPLISEIQLLIAEQPLNQSKLLDRVKRQDVTGREVRDLLENGVQRFWHRHKGDKNAWIYTPLTNTTNTANRIAD